MSEAREVFRTMRRVLNARGLTPDSSDIDEGRMIISIEVEGHDLPQPTFIDVNDKYDIIRLISPIPGDIPEDKRIDAAVAVVVANNGLPEGRFDLDMSDGEITYTVEHYYKGGEFTEETGDHLLGTCFIITDMYNDKFFMLGKGLLSLEKFIEDEQ